MAKISDKELKNLYKELDEAVSEKNIDYLSKRVNEANNEDNKDKRFKKAVYQYASLYRSEIPDVRVLEMSLRSQIEKDLKDN
jgi:hypothetical protein